MFQDSDIAVSDLPQRRCRCGVGELKDLIYAVGGFNGSLRVRSVDAYDMHTDKWFAAPPMDARSFFFPRTTRMIYLECIMSDVGFYLLIEVACRRSTLGVTVVDQMMIAVGGFDGSTGLSSAEAFDPRQGFFSHLNFAALVSKSCLFFLGQWMLLPSMTVRRSSVGVAALGGLIYAVGGYDGNTRNCLDSVEIYEPRANRWRSGPSLISRRSGAGVTVVGDRLVAVGGHDGPIVRETAEVDNLDYS